MALYAYGEGHLSWPPTSRMSRSGLRRSTKLFQVHFGFHRQIRFQLGEPRRNIHRRMQKSQVDVLALDSRFANKQMPNCSIECDSIPAMSRNARSVTCADRVGLTCLAITGLSLQATKIARERMSATLDGILIPPKDCITSSCRFLPAFMLP